MSQLTRCTYCILHDIRQYAKFKNLTVTLKPAKMSSQHHLETALEDGRPVARKIDVTDVFLDDVYFTFLWKIAEYCVCFKQP